MHTSRSHLRSLLSPSDRKVCVSGCLLSVLALCLSCAPTCLGQATSATAVRKAALQVGGGFSFADPDYSQGHFLGGSLYGTFDFTSHFGAEFMFHQVKTRADNQIYERTYELGPRYVHHYGRFNPFIKVSYGRGVFNYPDGVANLAYNMITGTAGVDVHVQRHVNVRAEYEAQRWFSFTPHDLQPNVISFGAAYEF